MKNKTKKSIIFVVAITLNFLPFIVKAAYTPMEKIPGFGETSNLPSYIMAIYKFGIWTIGIASLFMIMWGGYMYLTSGGNTSRTGKAKEVITDAIIGLALALVSYLLLYTINPELVNLNIGVE